MFETARLYGANRANFTAEGSLAELGRHVARAMRDEKLNIRPRADSAIDQIESPFKMTDKYGSAYVTGEIFPFRLFPFFDKT